LVLWLRKVIQGKQSQVPIPAQTKTFQHVRRTAKEDSVQVERPDHRTAQWTARTWNTSFIGLTCHQKSTWYRVSEHKARSGMYPV